MIMRVKEKVEKKTILHPQSSHNMIYLPMNSFITKTPAYSALETKSFKYIFIIFNMNLLKNFKKNFIYDKTKSELAEIIDKIVEVQFV